MDIVTMAVVVAFGVNLLLFIPAFINKTDKLTDISYALSFVLVALVCFAMSTREPLHFMILLAIIIWAMRLGGFLFVRINRNKRDKRFDGIREDFIRFFSFWLLQAATVFLVMIAAVLLWDQPNVTATVGAYIGIAIFALGLLIETTADFQKASFAGKGKNRHAWIDKGVWRLSRHPNYLGEILVWLGIYLAVFEALGSTTNRLAGAISPIFITCMLLFVSGIPLLEKSADRKWGKLHTYQTYKKRTPLILPSPSSLKRYLKHPG